MKIIFRIKIMEGGGYNDENEGRKRREWAKRMKKRKRVNTLNTTMKMKRKMVKKKMRMASGEEMKRQ